MATGDPSHSRETLGMYLARISRIKLLTREQEFELSAKSKGSGPAAEQAKEALIDANRRLVVSIARRYQGMGQSFDELIDEGNTGLEKAAEYFDPELGFRFSTYASKWIRQSITRALANHSRTDRIPKNTIANLRRYLDGERRLASEGDAAGGSSAGNPDHSVDPAPSELSESSESESRRKLQDMIRRFDDRERRILNFRFGLDGQEPLSLEETGKRVGVTRERARQIEKRCLLKIRKLAREL